MCVCNVWRWLLGGTRGKTRRNDPNERCSRRTRRTDEMKARTDRTNRQRGEMEKLWVNRNDLSLRTRGPTKPNRPRTHTLRRTTTTHSHSTYSRHDASTFTTFAGSCTQPIRGRFINSRTHEHSTLHCVACNKRETAQHNNNNYTSLAFSISILLLLLLETGSLLGVEINRKRTVLAGIMR